MATYRWLIKNCLRPISSLVITIFEKLFRLLKFRFSKLFFFFNQSLALVLVLRGRLVAILNEIVCFICLRLTIDRLQASWRLREHLSAAHLFFFFRDFLPEQGLLLCTLLTFFLFLGASLLLELLLSDQA